jgi:hypothetical protein
VLTSTVWSKAITTDLNLLPRTAARLNWYQGFLFSVWQGQNVASFDASLTIALTAVDDETDKL